MMRFFRRKYMCPAALLLLLSLWMTAGILGQAETSGAKELDLMFMHDVHSHMESYTTVEDGQNITYGGMERMKTLIRQQRQANPDTLVLDGGDFSMGTLVQTLFTTEAAELRMLGELGVDVTTLGNHEFDYRSEGLADMLKRAAGSGDVLPALALSNIDWESMEAAGLTEEQELLRDAMETYGVQDYVILDKGGVKTAVFGIFGIDALACAPTCVLSFRDPVEAAKETVQEIRENEDPDLIICVSHSGTTEKVGSSEDEQLAIQVPEIDLILSGHTHTELPEPIRHGDSWVVSCGEYGESLGSLTLQQQENGRWQMEQYALLPVTEEIEPDADAQKKIKEFTDQVNESYLAQFGYRQDQVLCENNILFSTAPALGAEHTEHNLGTLIADSYLYAVNQTDSGDDHAAEISVVPSGTVRDTYAVGELTVSDVFRSFSLGIGPDEVTGYPLISVYLTGAELRTAAEIDASISDLMTTARLYTSGLGFAFNPHRPILGKVTDVYRLDEDGSHQPLENDRLYRVIVDLYSGQMLGAVTDMSFGLLSVIPKDRDGNPIENLEDAIIHENGKELKAWDAIARYMQSFADTDGNGIGNVPEYYAAPHDRKVVVDSRNFWDLVKNPGRYTILIAGILAAVLAALIVIVVLVVKLVKRIRRKNRARSRV